MMGNKAGQALAEAANLVSAWCGVRDVEALEPDMADLFVLFGGGVIGVVDELARAINIGVARRYAIVGGRGHATFGLERAMEPELANWDDALCSKPEPTQASEAEMLAAILLQRHGLRVDLLETRSTNCGNNISFLFDLLDDGEVPQSVVICQDAVMQRRMGATWRRQVHDRGRYRDTRILAWAAYQAHLAWREESLVWSDAPWGIWEPDYYAGMLLGEVDRLTDDVNGYGPRGRDFTVHVDVPDDVVAATEVLRSYCGGAARHPDERFSSPQ